MSDEVKETIDASVDDVAPITAPDEPDAIKPAVAESETIAPADNTGEDFKPALDSAVQQILQAFKSLQESFDAKLRYDTKKEAIIDRQFQELSQFKAGLIDRVTTQIVTDLICEIDSAQKLVKFYENAECNEVNFTKLQKVLRDIPESLCDILEKYGVVAYSSSVGVPFNPKRQRALKTTETEDESKDKTIRELLRLGFEKESVEPDGESVRTKILRAEMVDVFVYHPARVNPSAEPEVLQQPTPEISATTNEPQTANEQTI